MPSNQRKQLEFESSSGPPPGTSTEARFKNEGIVAGLCCETNAPSLRRFARFQSSYKANFSSRIAVGDHSPSRLPVLTAKRPPAGGGGGLQLPNRKTAPVYSVAGCRSTGETTDGPSNTAVIGAGPTSKKQPQLPPVVESQSSIETSDSRSRQLRQPRFPPSRTAMVVGGAQASNTTPSKPSQSSGTENRPSSAESDSQSTAKRTSFSKKNKDAANWTMKETLPSLGSTSVQRNGNITVVPVEDCADSISSSLRINVGDSPRSDYGSMRSQRTLTTGQLNLVKSDSFGRNLTLSLAQYDAHAGASQSQFADRVRRASNRRQPLASLFDTAATNATTVEESRRKDDTCCCCCKKRPPPLAVSSPVDEKIALPPASAPITKPTPSSPPSLELPTTSTPPLPPSPCDTSPASTSHNSDPSNDDHDCRTSRQVGHIQTPSEDRKPHSREAAGGVRRWQRLPIQGWTTDEVLMWLQHLGLDEAAAVLVGYDLCGSDLLSWTEETLASLGIVDEAVQDSLLQEIAMLYKPDNSADSCHVNDGKRLAKSNGRRKAISSAVPWRTPLFNLVRSSSYDQIIAVEVALTVRDLSVAEGYLGCLQVTKVRGRRLPVVKGDCLLEINAVSTQNMPAVSFTKLISEARGAALRLVVLRQSDTDTDAAANISPTTTTASSSFPEPDDRSVSTSEASAASSSNRSPSSLAVSSPDALARLPLPPPTLSGRDDDGDDSDLEFKIFHF